MTWAEFGGGPTKTMKKFADPWCVPMGAFASSTERRAGWSNSWGAKAINRMEISKTSIILAIRAIFIANPNLLLIRWQDNDFGCETIFFQAHFAPEPVFWRFGGGFIDMVTKSTYRIKEVSLMPVSGLRDHRYCIITIHLAIWNTCIKRILRALYKENHGAVLMQCSHPK